MPTNRSMALRALKFTTGVDYMAYPQSPSRQLARRIVAALATISMSLAVCGAASASPKPAAASSGASAKAKIVADWEAFFSGTTSASRKIALVQDGKAFAKVIQGQAGSGMAKSVRATVSKVTLNSATKATVRYSLTMGGQPALSNQTGQAVLQSGTWKVGAQSFCALLALEQVKVSVCSSH